MVLCLQIVLWWVRRLPVARSLGHQVGGPRCGHAPESAMWQVCGPPFLLGGGWVVPKDKLLTSQQVRSDLGDYRADALPNLCRMMTQARSKPKISVITVPHHQTCFPFMKRHAEPQCLPINACLHSLSCELCLDLPPRVTSCSSPPSTFPYGSQFLPCPFIAPTCARSE